MGCACRGSRPVAVAGGDYFAGTFACGGLSGEQMLWSPDRFAREVMPAFSHWRAAAVTE
jgi:hypothetical protein